MEPEFSFPCRQELAAGSYSEPLAFISHSREPFPSSILLFNVFVPYVICLGLASDHSYFPITTAYIFLSALRVLCVSIRYIILLISPYYLTKRTTIQQQPFCNSPLRNMFLPPIFRWKQCLIVLLCAVYVILTYCKRKASYTCLKKHRTWNNTIITERLSLSSAWRTWWFKGLQILNAKILWLRRRRNS